MGCGASKNKIHVASTTAPVDNTDKKSSRNTKSAGSRGSGWGSSGSLASRRTEETRGGSAVSKASKHSMDSGFDDKDYAKVITETSDLDRVKEVEEDFNTPRDADLGVVGKSVPQRLSGKDRERMDEQRVRATLEQEGLIARPMSRVGHGVRFDIVSSEALDEMFGVKSKPPARLAKLEKRTKKKKRLTVEDIERKLAQAEERRKEQESQRLAKIQAVTMKSDVQNALDTFAQRQKEIVTDVKTKEEQALENRMRKLEEKKERLKAKREHAEAVRRRKMLAPINKEEGEEEIRAQKRITEDTPVGVSQEY